MIMKYSTLFILLTGLVFCVKAQNVPSHDTTRFAGEPLINTKCRLVHIRLLIDQKRADYPDLFHEISVADFRRDTSRIGLVSSGAYSQEQLVFRKPGGVAGNFYQLLDTGYATPKGDHSLLVAIKDCWISDLPDSLARGMFSERRWTLAFRLEAYLKHGDGYIPLTYLDTLVYAPTATIWDRELPSLTAEFMDKVAALDLGRPRARVVSRAQIDSFSRTRYNYPMDTATIPARGVYANVGEFRANHPSITDFQLSKDGKTNMELRVRDNDGKYYFTHTVWGLSTGSRVYVMMDGNLFPVFLVGHQFYVLGSKRLIAGFDGSSLGGFLPLGIGLLASVTLSNINTPAYRRLRVYRLDTGTGNVVP